MIKHALIIASLVLLTGCDKANQNSKVSKILTKVDHYQTLQFKSKGGGRSPSKMIDDLFKEARDDDDNLDKLYDEISEVDKDIDNVLTPYENYQNLQSNYRASMKWQIDQIKDSTLRKEAQLSLNRLERHIIKEENNYETIKNRTTRKRKYLKDLTTLMKLSVSEKLMYNHFAKKKPASQKINDLDNKLNRLQNQARKHIKK